MRSAQVAPTPEPVPNQPPVMPSMTEPVVPTPGLETPVVDATDPDLMGLGQRQSAMEMLRQILANLPLANEGLRPEPALATDPAAGTPQRPQNAFDVVRQLLEDMLPPAVGNAEEVATRAGELAAALAMLRGALGQIAQSEAAQTPQVPGTSGRLNLVI